MVWSTREIWAPVVITAKVKGSGEATDGQENVWLIPERHLNRPGLLLNRSKVYVGFGGC